MTSMLTLMVDGRDATKAEIRMTQVRACVIRSTCLELPSASTCTSTYTLTCSAHESPVNRETSMRWWVAVTSLPAPSSLAKTTLPFCSRCGLLGKYPYDGVWGP